MAIDRIHQLIENNLLSAPQKSCFIDFDHTEYSGSRALRAIHEAEALLIHAGVRGGDRVMLVGENAVLMCAFVSACSRLDAWVIPVNARQTTSELLKVKHHAQPRAMVFVTTVSDEANAHAEHFEAERASMTTAGKVRLLKQLDCKPEPCHGCPTEQVAALFYTTGTTGAPKGVMLTHANFIFMANASGKVRGLNSQDKLYCCIPITHIYAFASAMLGALHHGAKLQFSSKFSPADTFAAIRDGVTCMPAVPAMYAHLMEYADTVGAEKIDAPKLRYIAAGGAPLDPDWKSRVESFFGLTLHNGYGMTEASPGVTVTRFDACPPDSYCGPALPETEVILAAPPGQESLLDGVGEVLVRGPHVMKGYYRNLEASAAALDKNGFLHTGDLGRWTNDGCLEIVGRCKELIIRSGFNVYPPEVESALNSHPQVTQSAVVGRRQSDGNEEILAFVQRIPQSDLSAHDLQAWAKQRLSPYKVPAIVIVADTLPAAPNGKPLKYSMIEHFKHQLGEA